MSDHFRLPALLGPLLGLGLGVLGVHSGDPPFPLPPAWRGPSSFSYLQPCPQRGIALSRPGCCRVTLSLPTSHTRGQGCSSGGEAHKIRDRDAHTLEVAWCLNLGSIHFRCLGIVCHVSRTLCPSRASSPVYNNTHIHTRTHALCF